MTKEYLKLHGPTRVFINCPSILQPYHKDHGRIGIAIEENDKVDTVRIYFTVGNYSMEINPLYLAKKENL